MKYLKRFSKYVFVCILILSMLICTSCIREESTKRTKISILHGWGGTPKIHKIMQDIYLDFNKINSSNELISLPAASNIVAVEKANDMLLVDEMPAVVSTNGLKYYLENSIKKDLALDIYPYLKEKPELLNSLNQSIIKQWETKDGKLYTIPDALEIMGYWYNKDFFIKAGLVDKNGDPLLPRTWEEFEYTCAQIKKYLDKSNIKNKSVMALEKSQVVENLFLARLAGTNNVGMALASGMSKDYRVAELDTTLSFLSNLKKYSNNVNSITNARQEFKNGNLAFYFNGVWEATFFEDSENSSLISYSSYPSDSANTLSYVSAPSGYVFHNTKDKDVLAAEIEFMYYILSEDVQVRIARDTGQVPINTLASMRTFKDDNSLLSKAVEDLTNTDIQISTLSNAWDSKSEQIVMEYLYSYFLGNISKEAFIRKLEQNQ